MIKTENLFKYINTFSKQYGIYLMLIVVVAVFSLLSPRFLMVDNILTILRQVSVLGIVSVGMMMVVISGGIDLSVGAVINLVNILCAYLMVRIGVSPVVAVMLCLLLALVIGALQGALITVIKIPPLICTLAFMTILRGVSFLISGGIPISGFHPSFRVLGQGHIGLIPIPIVIMATVFAIGATILYKMYFGRYLYALGGNEEASNLSGVNVVKCRIVVYMICSLLAAFAGIVLLSRLNSGSPSTGLGFELDVITAVVLGGISISGGAGKISGVFAGVFILGIINNGLLMIGVSEHWQWVTKGTILIIAVGFDCIQKRRVIIDKPRA